MYVIGTVVQSTHQFILCFFVSSVSTVWLSLFCVVSEITLNVIFRSSLNMLRLTAIVCM